MGQDFLAVVSLATERFSPGLFEEKDEFAFEMRVKVLGRPIQMSSVLGLGFIYHWPMGLVWCSRCYCH